MSAPDDTAGGGASKAARKAYGEYLLLQGTREEITLDELCAEHPSVASELRRLDRRMAAAEPGPAAAASAGEHERISLDDSSISSSTLRRILEAGPTSDRYVRKGEINRGGMGAIVKVWDEDLRRTLAMKVVLAAKRDGGEYDEVRLTRFLEEAQITGQLDHPGVVPVHEVGMDSSGQVYFTMRLVRGRDLKEIFQLVHDGREGWSRTRALGVIQRVCEAMAFAHEKGVIHRDLKPANIMVGRFGETYVMDWGLAKVLGREDRHDLRLRDLDVSLSMVQTDRDDSQRTPDSPLVTMDGDIVGTPCYMAPEQARGRLEEVGPASDVYSVGSMLYTLLCNRMPYVEPGDRMSPPTVLGLLLHGPPKPILEITKDVPGELVAICDKAMARDPGDRYASTMEMGEDLRAYLEDRVVAAYEAGSIAEFRKWITRNKGMAVSIASAVVLALAGLAGIAWVQASANEELVELNRDIEDARDSALSANAELGEANVALEVASARAREQEQEALRNGYAANLAAADASLRAMNSREAIQRLDRCSADLRGWEWRRLRLEADSSLSMIELDSHQASAVAFSPDGRRLAVGTSQDLGRLGTGLRPSSEDNLRPIFVIDVATDERVFELPGHAGSITALAYTNDGTRIVSGSYDRSLSVWDAHTGELLQTIDNGGGFVTGLAPSPDGQRLAVSVLKKKAYVVDLADLDGPQLELAGHGSGVTAIAFNHDGTRIATGSRDRTVRLWDAASGEELATLSGHGEAVTDLAFSPDDRLIASACGEQTRFLGGTITAATGTELFLWDLDSSELVRKFEGHSRRIRSIDFSPDGRALVSASEDGTLRVWDPVDGSHELQLGHLLGITAVAFSPTGDLIASGSEDQTVRLWDPRVSRGVSLSGHRSAVALVSFWRSGTHALSASNDRTVRLWDPESGVELATWPASLVTVADAAVASDAGAILLVGPDGGSLWDTATATERLRLEPYGEGLTSAWMSRDGARIALGSKDGSVRLLDGATGEVLRLLEGLEESVGAIHASQDTSRVFCVENEVLYRWDLATGVPHRVSPEDASSVSQVIMNERGTHVAVTYRDGATVVHDAQDGAELQRLTEYSARVTAMAFNRDATRLAAAGDDRSVRLWEVRSGEPLLSLREPAGTVRSLAFDDTDERLLAGFSDGRVHVWCTRRGTQRHLARVQVDRARRMAQPIVAALFDELVEPSAVIARLNTSLDITDDVKSAAVSMARSIDGDLDRLESESLAALASPHESDATYARALWQARLAVQHEPDDEQYLRLEGMALARLGRYSEALPVLERSLELRLRTRRSRPDVLAFIAISQHHLGQHEDAAQTLAQLRSLMQISSVMGVEHALEFLREAQALITPAR